MRSSQSRLLAGLLMVSFLIPVVLAKEPDLLASQPELDPQEVFRSACDHLQALEAKHDALKGVSEVKPSLQRDAKKVLTSAHFVFTRNAVPPGKGPAKAKDRGKPFVYVSIQVWSGHSQQPPPDTKGFQWKGKQYTAWVQVYGSDAELVKAIRKAVQEPLLAPVSKVGKVTGGWQLTARLQREKVSAGKPVVVTLTLKNVVKVPLVYGEASPGDDYAGMVMVTDEFAAVTMPLTRYGKSFQGAPVKRFVTRTLKPGQEVTAILCVSQHGYGPYPGSFEFVRRRGHAPQFGKSR